MKGIPGHLATRDDIDHLRGYLGTPENRATVVEQLEAIRNTHWHYVFTRVLPTLADRAGPEPDCRVVAGQGADGAELHEFCLTVNPHSRLAALGMTLEEMDGLLAELAQEVVTTDPDTQAGIEYMVAQGVADPGAGRDDFAGMNNDYDA